jgi:hypothetical protein
MSAWRIVIKALHAIAEPTHLPQFLDGLDVRDGVQQARRMGLIEGNGAIGIHAVWWLTPLGQAWAEGRVKEVRTRAPEFRGRANPKFIFVATWLASLPRDISLACGATSRQVTPRHAAVEQ